MMARKPASNMDIEGKITAAIIIALAAAATLAGMLVM
jgi:hypothetical protein